jgi:hypothetical protein
MTYLRCGLALGMLLLLWGCVQTKPVPGYARAGDIVAVGLGGIERNSGGARTLSRQDLAITITDSANTVYELTANQVFKSYPDHAAFMNTSAVAGSELGLVPFDGGWFASVPLTDASSAPLALATGPATISVSSSQLQNTSHPWEGDLTSLPLEILPGQTTLDSQYLQQFVGYATAPKSFLVAPDTPGDFTDIAGAFMQIEYYDESYFADGVAPMVVPSSHNPYVQLSYKVVSNGNGTGSINIVLLNPEGFRPAQLASNTSSSLADLSVTLIYFARSSSAAIAKTKFALDTESSYYIDVTGAVVSGLTPTLTHFSDL